MPPNPAALDSQLATAQVAGLGVHNRSLLTHPETLHAIIKECKSREQVPGSLEMKETHCPWDGRMLPGLALPEKLRVQDFIIDQFPPTPETLHAILMD